MNRKSVMLSALLVVSLLAMPLVGCSRSLNLSLWAPLDGASFTSSPIVVRGNVSDAKAQLSVNDVAVEVDKKGDFHTTVEPLDGYNTISIVATRGDKIVTHSVTVAYNPPLVIELSSPEDKAELFESPVTVSGMVSAPAAKVTVNGIEAEVTNDGTFSASVELVEGENTIEIVASVEGKEPVTKTLTIFYEALTSEKQARNLAEEFVRNSPTFVFDGIEESLKLVEMLHPDIENAWTFVFHFDSRHAGYGDRTGQVLAEVITPHEAVITIEEGEIKSAVMDEKWDMLTQQMVEEE